MKNESLKKFLAKNGQDSKKILKEKEPDGDEEYTGEIGKVDPDIIHHMKRRLAEDDAKKTKKKLVVSDDPKWKGKLGKHDDCWK